MPDSSAARDRWKITVNWQTKIVLAPNALVAMQNGIKRAGLPDSEIQRLEVRRVLEVPHVRDDAKDRA